VTPSAKSRALIVPEPTDRSPNPPNATYTIRINHNSTSIFPDRNQTRIKYDKVTCNFSQPPIMGLSSNPSSAFTGVVIGLVSSFGSIVLIALVIFIFWVSGCASTGRIILDRLGRPGEYDDEQAFARDEAEALEVMDDMSRQEYLRAKGM
jgi:hypothetical protein